jgi:hypothetical protein
MGTFPDDKDASVRSAAFNHLRRLALLHGGALPWAAIDKGFFDEASLLKQPIT